MRHGEFPLHIIEAMEPRRLLTAAPPATELLPQSDSGESNMDNLTSATIPVFEVTAREAGVVHLEVDGSHGTGPSVHVDAPGSYPVTFDPPPSDFFPAASYAVGIGAQMVAAADFNGDGRADLAVTSPGGVAYVRTANADGTLNAPVTLTPTETPRAITAADFSGDGKNDIALTTNATLNVFMGNGDGTFAARRVYDRYPGFYLHSADINGDGFVDLISSPPNAPPAVSVWLGVGDGSFPKQTLSTTTHSGSTGLYDNALGDMNGDGKLDVLVANGENGVVYMPGNGDGTFAEGTLIPLATDNVLGVSVADMNGDGALDVVSGSRTDKTVFVIAGNGDGTFGQPQAFPIGAGTLIMTADFDRDGRSDVAASDYGGTTLSVALGNGDGTLHAAVKYSIGGSPFGLASGDFNADGRIDLATAAGSTTKGLSVLLGRGGSLTDGVHRFTAWAEDASGVASASSAELAVRVDTRAPVPALPAGQTPVDGTPTFEFRVRFDDASPIATIAADGVRVCGPNNFSQVASLLGVESGPDGSLTGTYTIVAPGGAWESSDNGMYAVTVPGAQLRDVAGNRANGSVTAGEFAVNAPYAVLSTSGWLFINGDGGNDTIVLQSGGSMLTVYRTGPGRAFPSAQVNAILVQGMAGNDALIVSGDFAQPVIYHGGTGSNTLTVQNSTFHLREDPAVDADIQTIQVAGGASVIFEGATTTVNTLMVSGGGVVSAASHRSAVRVTTLSIDPGGRLDLGDNDLIVDYDGASALDDVTARLRSGRNGGDWSGDGIVTSAAAGTPVTLAVGEASQVLGPGGGVFAGQNVDGSAVLVKYTYAGDANLDGKVTISDYGRIDFNVAIPGAYGWSNGDFNYDGKITISDYGIIDFTVGIQGPPLAGVADAAARSAESISRPAVTWDTFAPADHPRFDDLI